MLYELSGHPPRIARSPVATDRKTLAFKARAVTEGYDRNLRKMGQAIRSRSIASMH